MVGAVKGENFPSTLRAGVFKLAAVLARGRAARTYMGGQAAKNERCDVQHCAGCTQFRCTQPKR